MRIRDVLLTSAGILCTLVSIYQLTKLGLASFYTLFSIGMSLTLCGVYHAFADKNLFSGWSPAQIVAFWMLMLAISVVIDSIGMHVGYWHYPHYGKSDQVRKYIFEWVVALFYHFVALVVGIELFKKRGMDYRLSLTLSLFIFVTAVGFLTESLNLKVRSWQVLSMPISDIRIGGYFIVFQTIGYWLMALIPYVLYMAFEKRLQLSA
jgi:hypothetical protein